MKLPPPGRITIRASGAPPPTLKKGMVRLYRGTTNAQRVAIEEGKPIIGYPHRLRGNKPTLFWTTESDYLENERLGAEDYMQKAGVEEGHYYPGGAVIYTDVPKDQIGNRKRFHIFARGPFDKKATKITNPEKYIEFTKKHHQGELITARLVKDAKILLRAEDAETSPLSIIKDMYHYENWEGKPRMAERQSRPFVERPGAEGSYKKAMSHYLSKPPTKTGRIIIAETYSGRNPWDPNYEPYPSMEQENREISESLGKMPGAVRPWKNAPRVELKEGVSTYNKDAVAGGIKTKYINYGGKIVGDVTYYPDGDIAQIDIDEKYQRKGIGRKAIGKVIEETGGVSGESSLDAKKFWRGIGAEVSRGRFDDPGTLPNISLSREAFEASQLKLRKKDLGEKGTPLYPKKIEIKIKEAKNANEYAGDEHQQKEELGEGYHSDLIPQGLYDLKEGMMGREYSKTPTITKESDRGELTGRIIQPREDQEEMEEIFGWHEVKNQNIRNWWDKFRQEGMVYERKPQLHVGYGYIAEAEVGKGAKGKKLYGKGETWWEAKARLKPQIEYFEGKSKEYVEDNTKYPSFNVPLKKIDLTRMSAYPEATTRERDWEQIGEISSAIRRGDVMTPVHVRKGEKGKYVLVDGYHRYLAYKSAGMKNIPAYDEATGKEISNEEIIVNEMDLNMKGETGPLNPVQPEPIEKQARPLPQEYISEPTEEELAFTDERPITYSSESPLERKIAKSQKEQEEDSRAYAGSEEEISEELESLYQKED